MTRIEAVQALKAQWEEINGVKMSHETAKTWTEKQYNEKVKSMWEYINDGLKILGFI